MFKKISFILLLICLFLPFSMTKVYADDSEEPQETGTCWLDEDGNEHCVYRQNMTDSSIENGKYMPSSVTGEKFEGTGTVVDFVQTDTKVFYTIYTADDKIYYLIIDNTKDSNNVYFLREINEDELNFGYQYEVINNSPYAEDEVVQVEKVEKKNLPDTKTLIIFGLIVVAAVGFLILSKFKNKLTKKTAKNSNSNNDSVDTSIADEMYGNDEDDFPDSIDDSIEDDINVTDSEQETAGQNIEDLNNNESQNTTSGTDTPEIEVVTNEGDNDSND